MLPLLGLLAAALSSSPAAAQEVPPPTSSAEVVEEQRVPANLIAPVTPRYPDEALPEGLHGDVTILVTVGVDGAVVDASFTSGGPDVFVPPALEAARSLRFEPATLDGVPVQAHVPVTFHFEPPDVDPEDADEEIVVFAATVASEETHAAVTLGEQELDRAAGQDLGRTISQVSGVTTARAGSNATKPIIRGQYERRLLILFDGVRHESQKWGLDHAPEIDPFAAGEITVVKGAAGVRYGPDAIGGVVLVEPPPLLSEPGVAGKAQVVAQLNGLRGTSAARLDMAPAAIPGFSVRLEGNAASGAALHTPDYVLGNTASWEWNAGATLGYEHGAARLEASYHHYAFEGGVCYCVHNSTPDDLVAQIDAQQPIGAENWITTREITRPYQAVTHDLALARIDLGEEDRARVSATYAFQINLRQEYDRARKNVTGPQYDFTLRTHSLDLSLEHGTADLGESASLAGGLGLDGFIQENVYRGLPLIPNYRALQGGAYAYERANFGRAQVELGARLDALGRAAYLDPLAYQKDLDRGTLEASDCELGENAARCPASYESASVSLGGKWQAMPERLELKLDLSSASRFPNADELYMNGSAPTAPVYVLGDPSLGVETMWGASPTLGLRLSWIEAEASTYVNYIDDYVYFAPELGPNGEPAIDVTIQGSFPRYSFRPIDAVFYGVDGGLTAGPNGPLQFGLQGSVVRARDIESGSGLVLVPADRLQGSLRVVPHRLGQIHEPFVEISGLGVAEQTHVDPDDDLAPPPDAYFLLGAAAGLDVPLGDDTLHIGLEGTNLLNTRYREYTSLLRYYADEPGLDVRLHVALDF